MVSVLSLRRRVLRQRPGLEAHTARAAAFSEQPHLVSAGRCALLTFAEEALSEAVDRRTRPWCFSCPVPWGQALCRCGPRSRLRASRWQVVTPATTPRRPTSRSTNALDEHGRGPTVGQYSTGGRGTGQPHLPSQGSVVLTDDGRSLLVANAGSDEVSVFAVESDELRLTD